MNIEQLREYCIAKSGVGEGFPFGPTTLVFKVSGKMFLLVSLDKRPLQFNVKCDPEKAIDLREKYDCIIPGFHMNKKWWNTIIIDGSLSGKQLQEYIDDSYDLIKRGNKK